MAALLIIQFAILGVLLALSGFFSSTETAYFSLDPMHMGRLEADQPRAATLVHQIMSRPTRLLSTILVGNTVVNVSASSLGFNVAEQLFPGRGEAIAVPVMTVLLLVFGEIGPKRIAMLGPVRIASLYARVLPTVIQALAPARVLMELATGKLQPLFERRCRTLTEVEYESVIDISGEQGVLDEAESAMVKAIIGLEDLRVSDVMTARIDVVGIDLDDTPSPTPEQVREAGHHFLVLYRGQRDYMLGFLDSWAYLLDPAHDLAAAQLPPLFVPETMGLDRLLEDLQRTRARVAVVVDEYGGMAGMVTRRDILRRVTGQIDNEFGRQEHMVEQIGQRRWLVDAGISLEELNDRLGMRLEADSVDRLAGWVIAQAGHMPSHEETVEAQGCRVQVRELRGNRITLVALERWEAAA